MVKKLTIEYEVFEEDNVTVLSVVDDETDTVVNMFNGRAAKRMYKKLTKYAKED